ncbi:MAG: PadR family transcriptional regulator [Enhygromyxa sp.]
MGLLSEPATGYELKQVFDQTLRHFWRAELSQIYPCLKKLEARGLLQSEHQPSSRGPARQVYRRTAAGQRELEVWLNSPPDLSPPRLSFLAQFLHHGELGDLTRSRRFVLRLQEGFENQLRAFEALEEHWFGSGEDLPDDLFHGYLSLRFGLLRTQASLAWCDETLAQLDRRLAERGARAEEDEK